MKGFKQTIKTQIPSQSVWTRARPFSEGMRFLQIASFVKLPWRLSQQKMSTKMLFIEQR